MALDKSQSTVGSVTVLGRLSHTRGLSAFVVLVILTPLLVALTAHQAWVRTQLPDVGLAVDDGLRVESTDGRWLDVRRGDQLVALDGEPLRDPADWVDRAVEQERTTPLRVTFERSGKRWSVEAHAHPMRVVDQAAVWARVVTGAVLMTMGLVAFSLRPGVPVTWLLLLMSWDLGGFLLLKVGLYFDPRLYKQASTYPWLVLMAVGLHFLCYFPQRVSWMVGHPKRIAPLYLSLLVIPFVHVFHLESRLSTVGTLWGVVAGLGVTGLITHQYRQVRSSELAHSRSQYRALFVGFLVGLLLPAVWNWLRVTWGIWDSPWAAHYNALPLVIFVGVTSFAVVRTNALAIDRFTAAVLGYATTTLLLAGVFALLMLGIPLLVGSAGLADSPVLLVGLTALTFAGFSPLYRRVKRIVDKRFFRTGADAAEMTDALRELVLSMQQSSRDDAVAAAMEAASVLDADRVQLWLVSDDHTRFALSFSKGEVTRTEPVLLNGPLGEALRTGVTAGVEGLAPRVMDSGAQDELWLHQLAMAAPVMVHAVVAGFIAVGRKRSGAGFQLEELSFLSIIAAQLGPVLERSQADTFQLDRYHLERRIGTGGMAEVYLAWQVGPGGFERKVAVKRPLPHVSEDPNAVASFLDEARLAAQLQHANIAQVYDVGESDGTYFIVMEYVDGPSLRQVLRQLEQDEEHMPLPIAAALILSVLSALEYAHDHTDEQGRPLALVHRDITPRNILLNKRGGVKLVDFGIARAQFQLHVTRTGTIKGTLPYMSPEQAAGDDVDRRSDLYSAAALFYELVTGDKAYPKGPFPAPPVKVSEHVAGLPKTLDTMLVRGMAHDVDKRYPTATELGGALRDAMDPARPAEPGDVKAWLTDMLERMSKANPAPSPSQKPPSDDDGAEATVRKTSEDAATVVQVRKRTKA